MLSLALCSLVSVLSWATPSPPPPEPAYLPASVEARFSNTDLARVERIKPEVERQAIQALGYYGVRTDSDSNVSIVIQVLNVEEEGAPVRAVSDWGTSIEVRVDGEKVGEKLTPCMKKGEAELVGCALSSLPEIMELLPREETVSPSRHVVPTHEKPKPKLDATTISLFSAGGVLVAGGLTLGIVGALDHTRKAKLSQPENRRDLESTNYAPRGTAFLVGGSVALVGGAALLVVGAVRAKKQRSGSTRVQLDASPGFAGLRLNGRF